MIKFGTDGWRAIMAEEFTFDGVRKVSNAIAEFVLNHEGAARGIIVGYDTRFLSPRFADAAAQVLQQRGIKVWKTIRDTPTPVVAYAVSHRHAFGAIMITASHNPPEYNGIKFIPQYAGPASPEITAEIEKYLASEEVRPASSVDVDVLDPRPAYLEHIATLVDTGAIADSGLALYYDAMYGTGRGYLDAILSQADPTVLHNKLDPLFGGGMPEPKEEYLGELRSLVSERGGLGLATDGDADRFGVIDFDGTYVTPNQLIALLLHYLVRHKHLTGTVVRTVATTHLIDRIAAACGLTVRETPVGFKFIGECMRNEPVVIGGEESGGLSILGHLPEKDGLLACALAAEMRAVTGKPLIHTLNEVMAEVGPAFSRRIDLHLNASGKERLLERLKSNPPLSVGGLTVEGLVTVDGVKMLLSNHSWILVRPSGTEPLVRIYVESDSPNLRDRLIEGVQALVRDAV